MTDAETYRRRWERERLAREEAETIAERALADLYAANQALDARVREQTRDLTHALEEARRAGAVRDEFLHQLAHRTGSPMHIVQGFVELVAAEVGPGRLASAAAAAVSATRRLGRGFEGMLELSQVVAGGFDPQPSTFRAADWTGGVLRRWLPEVAAVGRTMVVDPGADPTGTIEVDVHRLDQIIDPLVDNAIHHGRGRITVGARVDGDRLHVSVADEGEGPTADVADRMFVPFWSSTDDGFGVGLSLALVIAEGLGGHLHLDPATSHTCLHAVLPIHDPSPSDPGRLASVDMDVLHTLVRELPVEGLARRLVEAWVGGIEERRASLVSGEPTAITSAAHALISGARQLGLRDLADVAAEVEHGAVDRIPLLLAALDHAPTSLEAALAELETASPS